MRAKRLAFLLLCVAGAASGPCDQPNQLGNNCETVNIFPTNVNNSSILTQTVTHVTTHITMPNGTITTIINTINYVGNSSERVTVLQSAGNASTIQNIYTNVIVQSDNSAIIALIVLIICLAVLRELLPWLKNRCARRQLVPTAAKVDPVDITTIDVKS